MRIASLTAVVVVLVRVHVRAHLCLCGHGDMQFGGHT